MTESDEAALAARVVDETVMTECLWLTSGSETCEQPPVYEANDPAQGTDDWWPACINCAAMARTNPQIILRTLHTR